MDGNLDLLKAIYNRVIKDFDLPAQSFELHTFVDAPAGSGLGTSSTLVVAVLGAFVQWLSFRWQSMTLPRWLILSKEKTFVLQAESKINMPQPLEDLTSWSFIPTTRSLSILLG